jgi:hypothetical protein
MANKNIFRILSEKEMQIKAILRLYLTLVRMATIKKTNNIVLAVVQGKKKGPLHAVGGNVN